MSLEIRPLAALYLFLKNALSVVAGVGTLMPMAFAPLSIISVWKSIGAGYKAARGLISRVLLKIPFSYQDVQGFLGKTGQNFQNCFWVIKLFWTSSFAMIDGPISFFAVWLRVLISFLNDVDIHLIFNAVLPL